MVSDLSDLASRLAVPAFVKKWGWLLLPFLLGVRLSLLLTL